MFLVGGKKFTSIFDLNILNSYEDMYLNINAWKQSQVLLYSPHKNPETN
jgi:hypothetical protein